MYKLLLTNLLLGIALYAQGGPAAHITGGPNLPAKCSHLSGDVFFKTTATVGLYSCTTLGTYSLVASSIATDPTKNGGIYFAGVTSGGFAFSVLSAAGGPVTLLLPTTDGTGLFLKDNGVIACPPDLSPDLPQICHEGVWAAAGGGVSSILHPWIGTGQNGTPAWSLDWWSLTNVTAGTVDATHIMPSWIVTANTTASAFWQKLIVNTAVTDITFNVSVASGGATANSGSMGISCACVGDGDAYANPAPTVLAAITLDSLATTLQSYKSTQAFACDGSTLPKTLIVWWTATAPTDQTLILLNGGVTY